MKIAYVGIDALYPALPALAEAGWSYRQILEYYFPGTALERGY